ncbi:MAG: hypothetical protein K2W96_23810 [Gemmataceae bacterium]|nr:hypothetical protein [Gemmataceae bacterium]
MTRLLARIGLLPRDRLFIPLQARPLRADAPLIVQRQDGTKIQIAFRVDSGCSRTLLPFDRAVQLGLPTTGQRHRIKLGTALSRTSAEAVSVAYRFWLHEGQRGAPFLLPVHLLLGQPAHLTPLLGLGGVVGQLRWTFDGRALPGAALGHCLMPDVRPASARFPG